MGQGRGVCVAGGSGGHAAASSSSTWDMYLVEEVVFKEMSLALTRTGGNGCQVGKNHRCPLHLARVCSSDMVLVIRELLWLTCPFGLLGSGRNWCARRGFNLPPRTNGLFESGPSWRSTLIKTVLCIWFRSVRPDALDFTRTTFYICRTETSSVKIGNYDTVRAMQAIFIYSLQNGNLAYSLLAISDG